MICILFSMSVTWYLLVSVATFAAYGYDKRRAKVGGWRLTERTLHWMELAGGWPGAMVAQRRFKHKRRKGEYMLVFRLIVALHAVAWGLVLVVWWKLL